MKHEEKKNNNDNCSNQNVSDEMNKDEGAKSKHSNFWIDAATKSRIEDFYLFWIEAQTNGFDLPHSSGHFQFFFIYLFSWARTLIELQHAIVNNRLIQWLPFAWNTRENRGECETFLFDLNMRAY